MRKLHTESELTTIAQQTQLLNAYPTDLVATTGRSTLQNKRPALLTHGYGTSAGLLSSPISKFNGSREYVATQGSTVGLAGNATLRVHNLDRD